MERSGGPIGRQRCAGLQGRFEAGRSHGPIHHEPGRRRPAVRVRSPHLQDGPFPEHYEPIESPIANPLHPERSSNPVARKPTTRRQKYGTPSTGFNVICTTYRLTEHYHYWTKNNPMNVQLVPEPFVEIPMDLANDLAVKGGDKIKVTSARGSYIAKAMVTHRIKPMMIDGKKTYQIGIPIHWGYRGIAEDAGGPRSTPVNMLTPAVVDPNAYTPEFKGFLVKVEKMRLGLNGKSSR